MGVDGESRASQSEEGRSVSIYTFYPPYLLQCSASFRANCHDVTGDNDFTSVPLAASPPGRQAGRKQDWTYGHVALARRTLSRVSTSTATAFTSLAQKPVGNEANLKLRALYRLALHPASRRLPSLHADGLMI